MAEQFDSRMSKFGTIELIQSSYRNRDVTTFDINARDAKGFTALNAAATLGNDETVRFLLTLPGIDVNVPSNTIEGWGNLSPLFSAASKGFSVVVALLLDFDGVDVNQPNVGEW